MMNRKTKVFGVCCVVLATVISSTAQAVTVIAQDPATINIQLRNVNAAGQTGGQTNAATNTKIYLVGGANGYTQFVLTATGTVINRADVPRAFVMNANVAADVEAYVNGYLGLAGLALNQRIALQTVYSVQANTTGGLGAQNDSATLSAQGLYTN